MHPASEKQLTIDDLQAVYVTPKAGNAHLARKGSEVPLCEAELKGTWSKYRAVEWDPPAEILDPPEWRKTKSCSDCVERARKLLGAEA